MKKNHLLFSTFLLLALCVKADEVITVHLNDTELAQIAIKDIAKITFETDGFHIITNKDNNNYFDYSEVSKLTFDEGTAIQTLINTNNTIVVAPNPVKEKLMISGAENMYGSEVRIYSVTGSLVLRHDNWNGETLNISHLNNGIYFVNLGASTLKFVKQ